MTATFRSSRRWVGWVFVGLFLAAILPAIDRARAQAPGEGEAAVVEVAGVEGKVTPVSTEAPIPTRNLWSIVRGGGLLMIPIAICSVFALGIIVERLIRYRNAKTNFKKLTDKLESLIIGNKVSEARLLCEESKGVDTKGKERERRCEVSKGVGSNCKERG